MTPENISEFTDPKLGITFLIEPPVPVPPGERLRSIGELFGLAVCDARREPLYVGLRCSRQLDERISLPDIQGDKKEIGNIVALAFFANGGRRRVSLLPVAVVESEAA